MTAFKCVLIAAFAVFGSYAKPMLNSGYGTNGCTFRANYASTMPIINTQLRTPAVDNLNSQISSFSSQNSNPCQYLKAIVSSQQIHNDVIADHVARAASSSVSRPSTFTQSCSCIPGFGTDRALSGIFQGKSLGSGVYATQAYPNCQSNNGYSGGSLTAYTGNGGGMIGAPLLTDFATSGSYSLTPNSMCSRNACY